MSLTVGYQGEPGAFAEEALKTAFPNVEAVAFRTLRHAFHRVADQTIDFALAPVENSQAGTVLETFDLLLEYRLVAVQELALQVDHCLLSRPGRGVSDLKRVLSDPQALAQCEAFIVRHRLEPVPAYDTATAARIVAEDGRSEQGAIASRRAAEIYGLQVLFDRIQTLQENMTRFLLVSRRGPRRPKPPRIKRARLGWRTTVACAVRNQPGALVELLRPFRDEGVNLSKLESRPRRDPPWEVFFYIDLDGRRSDKPVAAALRAVKRHSTFMQVLGTYPRALPAVVPPRRRRARSKAT